MRDNDVFKSMDGGWGLTSLEGTYGTAKESVTR